MECEEYDFQEATEDLEQNCNKRERKFICKVKQNEKGFL